jgi:hypothetical protein
MQKAIRIDLEAGMFDSQSDTVQTTARIIGMTLNEGRGNERRNRQADS